jgi:hypothetical protein
MALRDGTVDIRGAVCSSAREEGARARELVETAVRFSSRETASGALCTSREIARPVHRLREAPASRGARLASILALNPCVDGLRIAR